jgi:hypothetical protein
MGNVNLLYCLPNGVIDNIINNYAFKCSKNGKTLPYGNAGTRRLLTWGGSIIWS